MESSIAITLASTTAHDIPRRLKLGAEPIVVGRASRNELRAATAKPDNALFECPVVSREHAELTAQKNSDGEDEVTLTDLKSMHGTFVNGQSLAPGVPFTLQDGDLIQLGTSVARGTDTFNGVTVVFKMHSSSLHDGPLSTGSTYSVPAYSDIESEISDDFVEDVDDLDHYEEDAYDFDGHLHEEEEQYEAALARGLDEEEILAGTQQKPIEVDDWPAGSLRNVMDLTQPEVIPGKLPPMLSATPTYVPVVSSLPAPKVNGNIALEQALAAASHTRTLLEPRARQTSVELSTFVQPTARNDNPITINKPRYDPVRGTPPASSFTVTATEQQPETSINAPEQSQQTLLSEDSTLAPIVYSPGPPPSVFRAQPAKSNKRKAEVSEDNDETVAMVSRSLSQLCRPSPKRVKKTQPSMLQSIISDAQKYAVGIALGATGTFTFLASPLGGALADWASKY